VGTKHYRTGGRDAVGGDGGGAGAGWQRRRRRPRSIEVDRAAFALLQMDGGRKP
jgi:hypothetical protein